MQVGFAMGSLWDPNLRSKSSMLSASTISEMLEISFMNYMAHCLTGMLDEAPVVMTATVLRESVQEINYTKHFIFCSCLDHILHLVLSSIPFLAPLVTY